MGKIVDWFKKTEPAPLDEGVSLALREMADWPLQSRNHTLTRNRHRTVVTQRDHMGRVTGSVEQLDEDEYEQYSDDWGK